MRLTNDPQAFREELRRPSTQDQPRRRPQPQRRSVPLVDFAKLSFVEVAFDDAGAPFIDLWAVRRTQDYARDTAAGRGYANELITYVRAHDALSLLVQVFKAIVSRGNWTGVEVGFFHVVAGSSVRVDEFSRRASAA